MHINFMKLVLFLLILNSGLIAQKSNKKGVPENSSKGKTALVDTSGSVPDSLRAAADSLHALTVKKKNIKPVKVILTRLKTHPFYDARFRQQKARFYEDLVAFFSEMPYANAARSGDLGYAGYASFGGALPRFTQFRFDGVDWPAGLYGQSNLTALPETMNDGIYLSGYPGEAAFYSDAPQYNRPWTYAEYVNGPFDIDVLRFRFKRRFSKKISAYWSTTFTNSDGTIPTLINEPYDGQKIYGRTIYRLNNRYRIRHRFVNSSNLTTINRPFYLEEYPETRAAGSRRKESYNYNGIELAHIAIVGDSATQFVERDIWRMRINSRDQRERYSRRTLNGSIYHHKKSLGLEMERTMRGVNHALTARAHLDKFSLTSQTIDIKDWLQSRLQLSGLWQLKPGIHAQAEFEWQRRQDFKPENNASNATAAENSADTAPAVARTYSGLDAAARINYKFDPRWRLVAHLSQKYATPEHGEYANTINGMLTPNSQLAGAVLRAVGANARYQKEKVSAFLGLTRHHVAHPFVLNRIDTLHFFANASGNSNYFSMSSGFKWNPFTRFHITMKYEALFPEQQTDYMFWYLPDASGFAEMAWSKKMFRDDLDVDMVVRATLQGEKFVPTYVEGKGLSTGTLLESELFIDGEIRLHYHDAIIFFRFDNILNQQGWWLPDKTMRGRIYRYGVKWTFLN